MGTHNQRVEYGKKLVELGGKNPDIVVLEGGHNLVAQEMIMQRIQSHLDGE